MAPKTVKNPRKTARFYRDNPKSRAKKNASQRERNKSPQNKSTVLNSTQLEEEQVCMARAVKIFHTLSQED